MFRWTLFGIVILAVLSIVMSPARGDDWIVDDDAGPWRTHATIQDAINQSASGDNITVYEGVYHEDIVVNQTIELFGNGSGLSVINGSETANAVTVTSENVRITGFTVNASSSTHGVRTTALYTTVDNCTITDCDEGISTGTGWSRVDNCTFTHCDYGAMYWVTSRHYMRECTFSDIGLASVYMLYSERNTFRECIFDEHVGIFLDGYEEDHWLDHTINNCRLDGPGTRAVVYYGRNHNYSYSLDCGQVILARVDNATIENIDFEGGGWPIIMGMSKFVTVRNVTMANATTGIYVSHSNNVSIVNVSIAGMTEEGIYTTSSPHATVERVNVTDSEFALYLHSSGEYTSVENLTVSDSHRAVHCFSPHVTVESSTFTECESPVYVFTHNFTMRHCMINGTTSSGIYLRSRYSLYENNTIRDVWTWAFYLADDNCRWNEIRYNEMFNNRLYSVLMQSGAHNNTVHHNNFANNDASPQCSDNGVDNTWDDGAEGNYWDDWGGSGNYSIDGSANAADEYPLGDPVDTNAPEKVPEFGFMTVVTLAILALIARRRRR